MKFCFIDYIAYILVLIGALNWGLVGALELDVVAKLFGFMTIVSRAIYILVGVSALYIGFLKIKHGSCTCK